MANEGVFARSLRAHHEQVITFTPDIAAETDCIQRTRLADDFGQVVKFGGTGKGKLVWIATAVKLRRGKRWDRGHGKPHFVIFYMNSFS
jgi:hypothetical protein